MLLLEARTSQTQLCYLPALFPDTAASKLAQAFPDRADNGQYTFSLTLMCIHSGRHKGQVLSQFEGEERQPHPPMLTLEGQEQNTAQRDECWKRRGCISRAGAQRSSTTWVNQAKKET